MLAISFEEIRNVKGPSGQAEPNQSLDFSVTAFTFLGSQSGSVGCLQMTHLPLWNPLQRIQGGGGRRSTPHGSPFTRQRAGQGTAEAARAANSLKTVFVIPENK